MILLCENSLKAEQKESIQEAIEQEEPIKKEEPIEQEESKLNLSNLSELKEKENELNSTLEVENKTWMYYYYAAVAIVILLALIIYFVIKGLKTKSVHTSSSEEAKAPEKVKIQGKSITFSATEENTIQTKQNNVKKEIKAIIDSLLKFKENSNNLELEKGIRTSIENIKTNGENLLQDSDYEYYVDDSILVLTSNVTQDIYSLLVNCNNISKIIVEFWFDENVLLDKSHTKAIVFENFQRHESSNISIEGMHECLNIFNLTLAIGQSSFFKQLKCNTLQALNENREVFNAQYESLIEERDELNKNSKELNAQCKSLIEELDKLNKNSKVLNAQCKSLIEEYDELNKNGEVLNAQCKSLIEEYDELNKNCEELNAQWLNAKTEELNREWLNEKRDQLQGFKKEYTAFNKKHDELNAQCKAFNENRNRLNEQWFVGKQLKLIKFNSKYEVSNEKREELNVQWEALNSKRNELLNALKNLENDQYKVYASMKPDGFNHQLLSAELNDQWKASNKKSDELKNVLLNDNTQWQVLKEKCYELNKNGEELNAQCEALDEKYYELDAQCKALDKKRYELNDVLVILDEKYDKLNAQLSNVYSEELTAQCERAEKDKLKKNGNKLNQSEEGNTIQIEQNNIKGK